MIKYFKSLKNNISDAFLRFHVWWHQRQCTNRANAVKYLLSKASTISKSTFRSQTLIVCVLITVMNNSLDTWSEVFQQLFMIITLVFLKQSIFVFSWAIDIYIHTVIEQNSKYVCWGKNNSKRFCKYYFVHARNCLNGVTKLKHYLLIFTRILT